MAVLFGTCVVSGPALAQDCAYPEEAEAFAIIALRMRMMVDALICRAGNDYDRFVLRFENQLQMAERMTRDHFSRTSPANASLAWDRWNTELANAWSEFAVRNGVAHCEEMQRLSGELTSLETATSLAGVADRIANSVRSRLPVTCRAPDHPAAPLRP